MNNTTKANISTGEISFRGKPIPIVMIKHDVTVKDSDEIVSKLMSMSEIERQNFTIDSVRFDDTNQLDLVMYNNGDVSTVETAIALAENEMINGYTTGMTRNGGRTLRSKPNNTSLKTLKTF